MSDNTDLEKKFNDSAALIKTLTTKPDNSDLLILYGLYKRVTTGICNTPQPWAVQVEVRSLWDAWYKYNNMDRSTAMSNYINKVQEICSKNK